MKRIRGLTSLIVTVFLCFVFSLGFQETRGQDKAQGQGKSIGTVRDRTILDDVRTYKAKGILNPPPKIKNPDWPQPGGDDIVDVYRNLLSTSEIVVVGAVIDRRYRISPGLQGIETIYKLQVSELLKGRLITKDTPVSKRVLPGTSISALKDNEIFLAQSGGVLKIDGVMMRENDATYPPLLPGHEYVLFLQQEAYSPKHVDFYYHVFTTVDGPCGVVAVEGLAEAVRSFTYDDHELVKNQISRKADFVQFLRRLIREK